MSLEQSTFRQPRAFVRAVICSALLVNVWFNSAAYAQEQPKAPAPEVIPVPSAATPEPTATPDASARPEASGSEQAPVPEQAPSATSAAPTATEASAADAPTEAAARGGEPPIGGQGVTDADSKDLSDANPFERVDEAIIVTVDRRKKDIQKCVVFSAVDIR